jgi:hypothetical protein
MGAGINNYAGFRIVGQIALDTIFGKVWRPKLKKIAWVSYFAMEVAAYDMFAIVGLIRLVF